MHSTKENLQILFEDNHIIIVNKRAGDITQGDKTGDKPLSDVVKEYIKDKYNKPGNVYLGVVHRLDRPTSGIIIFAKTSKSLERLNKMLREKTINKTYWAVVKNRPKKEKDTLINFLKKNPKNNKSTAYAKEIDGSKKAILHYTVIKKLDNYSLIEVDLETGRHHQIRSQLSNIGSPIKGDLKYGFDRSNKDGSIHLHARKIQFIHPVTKEQVTVTAPTPKEVIWNACL
ncbi:MULTISPECIES: RluA family pseudouridine synthase [unclassified Polaribacter]|jgi:23S rRNA pseudouridine1911/1915/1917 synthase|uniref:RluA family pseudouridine synthase n=1 Tax=unclassified Polaribacter TaxID=196858 RepID=UPI001C501185|nr:MULTISPECIES: RluA family pseudouridine synthase [unclassified Polaribacter]QXP65476.1 RluA family pseudouridine synthase [Polaribacter sp. AHE13PA]QXP70977.1 RluA family pseudouridine synthase [Polaribacter sp. R2A056_3_33]